MEDKAKLPESIPLGFDRQTGIRATALAMSVKFHSETVIKDAGLYQQYKLENKPISVLNDTKVLQTAIAYERYLRGDYAAMADALVGGDFEAWLKAKVDEVHNEIIVELDDETSAKA